MQERRAADFSLAELARFWNLGYAGYFVPIQFTEAQLAAHLRCGGIDLHASPVWLEGDAPVGFSYLGVRGGRGWIGGFGVTPAFRGRGLSYDLFARHVELIRGMGLTQVQLEVFTVNWARRVYERAGFAVTRQVAVLHGNLAGGGAGEGAHEADPLPLLAHHARLHAASTPTWNREADWVREAVALGGVTAMAVGGEDAPEAVAWVRDDAAGVRVIDAAAETDRAAAVLAGALAARFGGRSMTLVNEPEDSSVHRALLAGGLEAGRHQHEMHLRL